MNESLCETNMSCHDHISSMGRKRKKQFEKLTRPNQTTAFLTLIGAASALVARVPPLAGAAFEAPNTLIQYQRWCPVCETVALNQACIAKRASCQASTLVYVINHQLSARSRVGKPAHTRLSSSRQIPSNPASIMCQQSR